MRLKIAPSILAARFERLGADVEAVASRGAAMIHVDVMDGHFVPNLSMGPVVVEALRRCTSLPLDVHLMITDPERHLESFIKAGADSLTVHVEACRDPRETARWLRERGKGAGLALNPPTPVERVLDYLDDFDLILVMTVHPGFGGQTFLRENLQKVRRVREEAARTLSAPEALDLEVDGGVDRATALLCARAGANVFVAGSAIYGSADPGAEVEALLRDLERVQFEVDEPHGT